MSTVPLWHWPTDAEVAAGLEARRAGGGAELLASRRAVRLVVRCSFAVGWSWRWTTRAVGLAWDRACLALEVWRLVYGGYARESRALFCRVPAPWTAWRAFSALVAHGEDEAEAERLRRLLLAQYATALPTVDAAHDVETSIACPN